MLNFLCLDGRVDIEREPQEAGVVLFSLISMLIFLAGLGTCGIGEARKQMETDKAFLTLSWPNLTPTFTLSLCR